METRRRASEACRICGGKIPLSKCLKESGHLSSVETLNKFTQQLGLPGVSFNKPGDVKLCDECLLGVVKAVELCEQLGDAERDVRSLQRIILKMMRQLKSVQQNYLEEMTRLERKISGSNIEAGDALQQGILDVVSDLGVYQQDSKSAAASTPPQENNSVATSTTENDNDLGVPTPSQNSQNKDVGFSGNEHEEIISQNQDPLDSTDTVDIEYEIYTENLTKREEWSNNFDEREIEEETVAPPPSPGSSLWSSVAEDTETDDEDMDPNYDPHVSEEQVSSEQPRELQPHPSSEVHYNVNIQHAAEMELAYRPNEGGHVLLRTCDFCLAKFRNARELSVHNKTEHPELCLKKCDKDGCTFSCTDISSLRRHQRRSRCGPRPEEPQTVCQNCCKTFSTKFNLNKHVRNKVCKAALREQKSAHQNNCEKQR